MHPSPPRSCFPRIFGCFHPRRSLRWAGKALCAAMLGGAMLLQACACFCPEPTTHPTPPVTDTSDQVAVASAAAPEIVAPSPSPVPTPIPPPVPVPPLVFLAEEALADPGVFKEGDYFYCYGTSKRFYRTKTFDPDDIEWFDMEVDFGPVGKGAHDFWAFRVYKHTDGTFHAYASIHFPWFRTIVGHLVPAEGETWTDAKPVTHWRLSNILVGDLKLGNFSYDATVVRDDDGALYLFYASGHPNEVGGVDIHIKVRRMLDPGAVDPDFTPRAALSPEGLLSEDRDPNFIQILEGAHLYKIGGKWALLYSVGNFGTCNYKIGVAWSDTLLPPEGQTYRKVRFPDPENIWKNEPPTGSEVAYLIQSHYADWPNHIGEFVCGPGHGNLATVGDRTLLVFHARRYGKDRRIDRERHQWTIPVEIEASPDIPMRDWLRPVTPPPPPPPAE